MVYYEVNLTIQSPIYDAYMTWLRPHIDELLTFDGFVEARVLQQTDQVTRDHQHITVLYTLENQAALDQYLQHHAPQMRDDGIKRFGEQFSATRRVFNEITQPMGA